MIFKHQYVTKDCSVNALLNQNPSNQYLQHSQNQRRYFKSFIGKYRNFVGEYWKSILEFYGRNLHIIFRQSIFRARNFNVWCHQFTLNVFGRILIINNFDSLIYLIMLFVWHKSIKIINLRITRLGFCLWWEKVN